MDIHPIIVHVPVAFLAVYSLLEIFSFIPVIRKSHTFFYIKFFLLLVGFLGIVAALMSGENAFHLSGGSVNKALVHDHEEMGTVSRNIYLVLLVFYATLAVARIENLKNWLSSKFQQSTLLQKLLHYLVKIGTWIDRYYVLLIVLAVAGLIFVSITGALGGAIVFGTDTKDPLINFVVKKFGY